MESKLAYSYHPQTGEFTGEVTAWGDPMAPGEFLLPGNATFTKPPKFKDKKVRCFREDKWVLEDAPTTLKDKPHTEEQLALLIRNNRTRLLAACDWTVLVDTPTSPNCRNEFIKYRQALRDIPQQEGFPTEVKWPTEPTIN